MTTMRGKGSTFGAVSIVNAIAGGKGATASVKLTTEAEVEMESTHGPWEAFFDGKKSESSLAVETVRCALRSAGKEPKDFSGRIETKSKIPVGVGLKTSSSASTATALAVYAALGQKAFDPQKVLTCSVEASLASGASITGALDDASGCLLGGLNHTDNLSRKIIQSKLFDKRLKVVIKVPKTASKRGSTDLEFIRRFGNLTDVFFQMSLQGDPWKAMVLNGITYSSILKYDPFPALRAVELGALGAGLSGTGPSVAAVFDSSKQAGIEALAKDWASDGSNVIETETNNEHGRILPIG